MMAGAARNARYNAGVKRRRRIGWPISVLWFLTFVITGLAKIDSAFTIPAAAL
jgi:uncharacterized membrane protein (DUF485 family)